MSKYTRNLDDTTYPRIKWGDGNNNVNMSLTSGRHDALVSITVNEHEPTFNERDSASIDVPVMVLVRMLDEFLGAHFAASEFGPHPVQLTTQAKGYLSCHTVQLTGEWQAVDHGVLFKPPIMSRTKDSEAILGEGSTPGGAMKHAMDQAMQAGWSWTKATEKLMEKFTRDSSKQDVEDWCYACDYPEDNEKPVYYVELRLTAAEV